MPNCPIVACRMTDQDVVERVAACFGTKVHAIDRGTYRTEYAATIKGSRAVELMADLKPLMGNRRRRAIQDTVSDYTPPHRKLSFEVANEIRGRFAQGESIASLSRAYHVRPQTVRPILRGEIYSSPPLTPWRDAPHDLRAAIPPSGISQAEFYWLAGWLEGEGSFMAPAPSDPRRTRISAQTKDRDVVTEACRLLHVAPSYCSNKRTKSHGWAPTWRLLLRGTRATDIMERLTPILGTRRQRQIAAALSAANRNLSLWRRWDSNPRVWS